MKGPSFSQMLKLSLLCLTLCPLIAISAPTPGFWDFLCLGKGKREQGEGISRGNVLSNTPPPPISEERLHVDAEAGIAASKHDREMYPKVLQQAKDLLREHGSKANEIYSAAAHITKKGYAPSAQVQAFQGGPIDKPLILKKHSEPYAFSIQNAAQRSEELDKEVRALNEPIKIYQNTHLLKNSQELLDLQKSLETVRDMFHQDNLPHRKYRTLPPVFDSPSHKELQNDALQDFQKQKKLLKQVMDDQKVEIIPTRTHSHEGTSGVHHR